MNIDTISTLENGRMLDETRIRLGTLSGTNDTLCNHHMREHDDSNSLVYEFSFRDGKSLTLLFTTINRFFKNSTSNIDRKNIIQRYNNGQQIDLSLFDLDWVPESIAECTNRHTSENEVSEEIFPARISNLTNPCDICGKSSLERSTQSIDDVFGFFGKTPVKFHGECLKMLLVASVSMAGSHSEHIVANLI